MYLVQPTNMWLGQIFLANPVDDTLIPIFTLTFPLKIIKTIKLIIIDARECKEHFSTTLFRKSEQQFARGANNCMHIMTISCNHLHFNHLHFYPLKSGRENVFSPPKKNETSQFASPFSSAVCVSDQSHICQSRYFGPDNVYLI